MGYVPSMKFASGFEIYEYCQAMAERFGFYERCLFHTTVERTEWDETTGRWTVLTDRGDAMRARFVILANGILTTPKLARIRRHGDVRGRVVPHLAVGLRRRSPRKARRDHRHRRDSSAGDPRAGQGRRRALRLPADTVDHRRARPARDDGGGARRWASEPGWARARRARFAKISQGRAAIQANDDYLAGQRRRTTRSASSTSAS